MPRHVPLGGFFLVAGLLRFLRPKPYVAIFPATVNMAVNAERYRAVPAPLLWGRRTLQGALIAWVWRAGLR
jgi:uncharacterized membrane protein